MPLHRTRAIVIRTQNLGEADKIIIFYTPYLGKVSAVARSARKPKSRFGGSLELLNYGELVFFERPKKDLHIVNSFDIINTFNQIRNNLTKTAYCFYIAELIGLVISGSNVNPRIFQLVLHVLPAMGDVNNPELLIHAFELKLLTLAGYRPELSRCVVCGSLIDEIDLGNKDPIIYFTPRLGGITCRRCSAQKSSAIKLSRGSRALMERLHTLKFSNINRFHASKQNNSEIRSVISAFIEYHFERPIKSWELIDDIAGKNDSSVIG